MTKTDQILIKVSAIEQHLKDLNGTIKRHEGNISTLFSRSNENKIQIGRIIGIGVGAGIFGGLITGGIILLISFLF